MNDRELELGLEAIRAERTNYPDVADVRRHVLAAPIEGMAQKGSWLSRPENGLRTMFTAARFVVAGVFVALFAGLLLAGVLTLPSDEGRPAVGASASVSSEPTAEPATESATPREQDGITLPADLPDGTRAGTLDTPLGPARWAYVSGDALSDDVTWLPGTDVYGDGAGGYVMFDGRSLMRSTDLIDWTRGRIPIDRLPAAVEGSRTADAWWIHSRSEPARLWGSADGSVWTEVDTSSVSPQGPEGFLWRPGEVSGAPVAFAGTTVVPFTFRTDQAGSTLGLADKTSLTAIEPGLYDVSNEMTGEDVLVRFEDTGTGVRVSNEDSGEELAFLEGVSMDFVEHWAFGPELTVQALAILDEDGLTPVKLPEAIAQAEWASLLADDRGFVAYTTQSDEPIRVHRSQDGRDWSETGVLSESTAPARVRLISGVHVIEAEDGMYASWGDGIFHRQPHHTGPERAHSTPLGAGWIFVPGQAMSTDQRSTLDSITYQPLGGTAFEIDVSALAIPATGSEAPHVESLSGNTIVVGTYVVIDEQSESFEQWIISFDDVPA